MNKIRIMVVDDSALIRRMLVDVLSQDPALEVVGTAANGRLALMKLSQLNPDAIILDVEMPEMNGLETLAEIRKTHRRMPIIMFSTLTERGAAATLDALALGATDYITKPSSSGGLEHALQQVRAELIPKIKELTAAAGSVSMRPAMPGANLVQPAATFAAKELPRAPLRRVFTAPIQVLVIGISTGGPDALAKVMPRLPADLPVPILIVQHMPTLFTKLLAERLSAKSAMTIREGSAGEVLRPGEAWIAPGGYHMVVENVGGKLRLQTNQESPENSCRPAVDVLFRSAVDVYGSGVLAVVMTGMGCDGLRGCEVVHAAGGQVIVQDEKTSVVWSMPGSVAKAGLADKVLPLDQIAPEIIARLQGGARATAGALTQELVQTKRGN
jgi:two-component system, chemotaxis family, protein-glutamate methylesterase/glutaminase